MMWANLEDIAQQVVWYGVKLTKDEWKDVLTAALKKHKVVPGIEGGFVVIGARTSKMTVPEMTELIELLEAEGLRDKLIVCCGGPRITHELAKELGYDAGFGMNTFADNVASYIAEELVRRIKK